MKDFKKSLVKLLMVTTSLISSHAMEADLLEKEKKVSSAAAAFSYKLDPNNRELEKKLPESLAGFELMSTRYETEGSIRAISLYNEESNTAIISYRGTESAEDWKANLGIGVALSHSIHSLNYEENSLPVRLPEYFSKLTTKRLQGLLGSEFQTINLNNLSGVMKDHLFHLPLSSTLDNIVSTPYLTGKIISMGKDVGKTALLGTLGTLTTGAAGAGAGSVIPGFGTIAGFGIGFTFGAVAGIGATTKVLWNHSKEIIETGLNKTAERQKHLEALESAINTDPIKLYTLDATNFMHMAMEKILSESDADERPKVLVTGHSLGRFLAGAAYLEYVGAHNTTEEEIHLDGINTIQNFGFNGPAGFQGLPLLKVLKDTPMSQNISSALSLKHDGMHHFYRANDVVGNLGREFDLAKPYQLKDVVRQGQWAPQDYFLANHGIERFEIESHPIIKN